MVSIPFTAPKKEFRLCPDRIVVSPHEGQKISFQLFHKYGFPSRHTIEFDARDRQVRYFWGRSFRESASPFRGPAYISWTEDESNIPNTYLGKSARSSLHEKVGFERTGGVGTTTIKSSRESQTFVINDAPDPKDPRCLRGSITVKNKDPNLTVEAFRCDQDGDTIRCNLDIIDPTVPRDEFWRDVPPFTGETHTTLGGS